MKSFRFTLPIQAVPKARPRLCKSIVFTPRKTLEFEKTLRFLSAVHRPKKPLEGPISLTVRFYLKKPKKPKNKRFPTVKPDLDNLLKSIKDAFNNFFWNDDAQVVEYSKIQKLYVENDPRIEIEIKSI